jgi:uncharacterized membrane protein YbhN (UPF0104 family)
VSTSSEPVHDSVLPAEALGARPGPRSVLLKTLSALVSGGLLVLLFAAIIPALSDFGGIRDELAALSLSAVLLLLILAVAIRVLLAQAYALPTPGISLFQSLIAREASSAMSNVVPGPSGTATQFLILHSWGVSVPVFTQVTVAVSVLTNALIFTGPGIAFVVWALLGMPAAADGQHAWGVGLAALVMAVLAVAVIAVVARSERLTARLGRAAQACVNPLRRIIGKPPVTAWPERLTAVRTNIGTVLRDHGLGLSACVVAGYVINGVLLVLCIWACGVSRTAMPFSLGLLLYTVGRLSTVVTITPGGVGVVEIAYTAVYVAVLGEATHDSVFAGVLMYRAFTYLLPIVTGALAYVAWRLMRRRENRRVAAQALV